MLVEGLKLPKELVALIDSKIWPERNLAHIQNVRPLVPRENIKHFAPEGMDIYFAPPPFCTVATAFEGEKLSYQINGNKGTFWEEFGCLEEIIPEQLLIIGDYGLGSDQPIALDYRQDVESPHVIHLEWIEPHNPEKPTRWVKIANTFSEFVIALGL